MSFARSVDGSRRSWLPGRAGLCRVAGCLLCAVSAASAEQAPSGEQRAADPPPLSAQLTCPLRAGPGRIVCELVISAPPREKLRWADTLVIAAPDFALPLRARVAGQVPEEGASRVAIHVPLYARDENTGVIRMLARALACPASGSEPRACITLTREVSASVAVTREPSPPR